MADAAARRDILAAIADAADEIGFAVASLGEAYEHLDDRTGDELEERLFRPAQAAYGTAVRTHSAFAARHGLPAGAFAARTAPAATRGPRPAIDAAAAALLAADDRLAELQGSMLPVEYGDQDLRAGLAEVRRHLDEGRLAARSIVRTLGR